MLRQQRIFVIILFSLTIAVLLPALFIYYIDPFQIYHRSQYPNMGLSQNQRFQNAGLINSYLADPAEGYDSVMIGSSLSDNFASADAQRYLSWNRTLRLFIDGADPNELQIVARHAASKPTTAHVLWEIRPRYYSAAINDLTIDDEVFPSHLYNAQYYDDVKYLLNWDILVLAIDMLHGKTSSINTENIGYWGGNAALPRMQFNSTENIFEYRKMADQLRQADWNRDSANGIYPVIDDELIPFITDYCNKNIEFIFYIPPVTKMDYLSLGVRSVAMPRYIVKAISNCGNFSLHAFDLEDFSNDLINYKDQEHYLPDVNKKILELIGKKSNVLTAENIDAYENNFLKAVIEYNPHTSYK